MAQSVESFATCAISEMGFLRVSLSPAFGASFEDAMTTLGAIVSMRTHQFLRDSTRGNHCRKSTQVRTSPTRI